MGKTEWTKKQQQCIDARGGSVLVSAAAGSGKTSVLVERVISKITDAYNPIDIDKMLIVTFTNAAAAEMKSRLAMRIGELVHQNPMDFRLQRQQILLPNAQISTIHSFCMSLIKDNFHLLGLSPNVSIVEDYNAKIMRHETVQSLLDEEHDVADANSPFALLNAMLGRGKNDDNIANVILNLHENMQALAFPDRFMADTLHEYQNIVPILQSSWGKIALSDISSKLEKTLNLLTQSLNTVLLDELLAAKFAKPFEAEIAVLSELLDRIHTGEIIWDDITTSLSFMFTRLVFPKTFSQFIRKSYPE